MLGVVWNFLAKNFCPSPPQILVKKVRRFRAGRRYTTMAPMRGRGRFRGRGRGRGRGGLGSGLRNGKRDDFTTARIEEPMPHDE